MSAMSPQTGRPRDARLPDPSRRPINVTPHIAVTTAAALNAERSAQKLKRALLAVRKEPLLNTKAAVAPAAPVAFSTPGRPSGKAALSFNTPLKIEGSLFGASPSTPPDVPPITDWDLPEDRFNPTTPTTSSRRGGGGGKHHDGAGFFRKAPTPSPSGSPAPPPAPSFDWGPLPSFTNKPPATIAKGFLPISFAKPSGS